MMAIRLRAIISVAGISFPTTLAAAATATPMGPHSCAIRSRRKRRGSVTHPTPFPRGVGRLPSRALRDGVKQFSARRRNSARGGPRHRLTAVARRRSAARRARRVTARHRPASTTSARSTAVRRASTPPAPSTTVARRGGGAVFGLPPPGPPPVALADGKDGSSSRRRGRRRGLALTADSPDWPRPRRRQRWQRRRRGRGVLLWSLPDGYGALPAGPAAYAARRSSTTCAAGR